MGGWGQLLHPSERRPVTRWFDEPVGGNGEGKTNTTPATPCVVPVEVRDEYLHARLQKPEALVHADRFLPGAKVAGPHPNDQRGPSRPLKVSAGG